MENPSRVRWGLVGTGGFAGAVFAPALRNAGQELLGAAGSAPQGSLAFAVRHGAPRTYASLETMLRDPDVDAVWIASPNHLHEEHVRMALEAGKHVLAEKPLAIIGSGARNLADLSERLERRLAVAYQGRFHTALRDLHARVREGALGEVAYVRASWQTRYAGLPDAWRLRPNTSGGWAIMDIGTHTLDAALWLTGFAQPRLLGSRLSTQHWSVAVEDLAVLLLQLGNATAVVEAATGVQGPANRVEVYGTGGWALATGVFVPRPGAAWGFRMARHAPTTARRIRTRPRSPRSPPGPRVGTTLVRLARRAPSTSLCSNKLGKARSVIGDGWRGLVPVLLGEP